MCASTWPSEKVADGGYKDILGKKKVMEALGDPENMPLRSLARNPPPTGAEALLPTARAQLLI